MASSGYYTLVSAATRTASGTSVAIPPGDAAYLIATLDVTGASGTTPTLDVVIEDGPTESGPWTALATFGQKTAVSREAARVTHGAFHRFVRARWTVGGVEPSFTFSVQLTIR